MSPQPSAVPLHGTVLVTGASSGIGEAIARRLAGRARRLVLVARREARLQALADELRQGRASLEVQVHRCDLTDPGARERLLERLLADGGVDVLVNNAGFGDKSLLARGRWSKLERLLELNVVALTHLTHRLLPPMLARGRGAVLNVGSVYGLLYTPGVAVYVGSKFYVTGFSETLRAEVSGAGITVTLVCPGPVVTEFHDITESTIGQRPPRFLAICAEQCAAEAIEGLEAGRAMVVPGFWVRTLVRLHGVMPRALWRPLAARLAEPMRAAPHDG